MEDVGLLSRRESAANSGSQAKLKWTFRVGQCVSHIDQTMPSLVMDRLRGSNTIEIYGVRSFARDDALRDRLVLGDSLVNVTPGSEPCIGCLLHQTGMCPGA